MVNIENEKTNLYEFINYRRTGAYFTVIFSWVRPKIT